MSLWDICRAAIGHQVRFKGTNGDEYDTANHGKPIEGEGYCVDFHDSHGLCIMVKLDSGLQVCVDPDEVIILD